MARIIHTERLRPTERHDPDITSWIYNGLDCCVTAEVFSAVVTDLDEVTTPIYELSKALQGPILDMNLAGILVDQHDLVETKNELETQRTQLIEQLDQILAEGYGVADMNWNSPVQLVQFLYGYLRLPPIRKRNDKGQMVPTANRKALEKLAENYLVVRPLTAHILQLRDLSKRLGFLRTEIDNDHRLRTSYNIAGTSTGRLSSAHSDFGTGTNNQNIDRRLRRVFVASPGKKMANLDLGQADSRNIGGACWNAFLESHGPEFAGAYLDACESGDLHTTVTYMARPELDWPEDEDCWRWFADQPREDMRGKSYRDASKNWGHGSNYLLTPQSAVEKIPGVALSAAVAFRKSYFAAFPCIPALHEDTAQLLRTGSITTILGRRRNFYGRYNDDRVLREAVAFRGQSPTADEINRGILILWRGGRRFPGFQLLAQVHDSVLFEFDEECEDEIIPWAIAALTIDVPLLAGRILRIPVDAKTGWNWQDFDKRHPEANPDGMMEWKGHDPRRRAVLFRDRYRLNVK